MSQIGTITSCSARTWCQQVVQDWTVNFSYQLDAGGVGTAQVIVGNGSLDATVAPWTAPNATVSVTAPGAVASILLPCPPLVQAATFGQALR
jgi:hypothetical protein